MGFFVSLTYAAPPTNIPLWIKNNAGWWADDQISDQDYLSGIEFLVSEGIIKIPVKEVIATHSTITDAERAHGFIVRMKFSDSEKSYYSFSRIVEVGSTQKLSNQILQLESIPSADKSRFYDEVEKAFSGQEKTRFDVALDIINPAGKIIETISYSSCEIDDHWVYVNDNKEQYRFTKTDGPEIREVTNFVCGGYHPIFP